MSASIHKSLMVLVLAAIFIMGPWSRSLSAGVAVAPLKQEISLKPGEEGKIKLLLSYVNRTQTDTRQKMQLTLSDVRATEDGSLMFDDPGTLKTSASKWISLVAGDLELEPGQTKTVECTVKVPLYAAPGEYYSVAMVTLAQKGVNENGVAVQYRIASGIFITVLGRTFPREARITQCALTWPQVPAAGTQAATGRGGGQINRIAHRPPDPAEHRRGPLRRHWQITVYDDKSRSG